MGIPTGVEVNFLSDAADIKADLAALSTAIKSNNISLIGKDLQKLLQALWVLNDLNLNAAEKKTAAALSKKIDTVEDDISSAPTNPKSGSGSSDASSAATSAGAFEGSISDTIQTSVNTTLAAFKIILENLKKHDSIEVIEQEFAAAWRSYTSLAAIAGLENVPKALAAEMQLFFENLNERNYSGEEQVTKAIIGNLNKIISVLKNLSQ